MRNFQIRFLEYGSIVFGTGTLKIEQQKGKTEMEAVKSFLKYKKSTGQIIVIKTIRHVPT